MRWKLFNRECRVRLATGGAISQFKRKLHNGELRVRGPGKVRNSVILMAIGISFGRLWAYFLENNTATVLLLTFAVLALVFLARSLVEEPTEVKFKVA